MPAAAMPVIAAGMAPQATGDIIACMGIAPTAAICAAAAGAAAAAAAAGCGGAAAGGLADRLRAGSRAGAGAGAGAGGGGAGAGGGGSLHTATSTSIASGTTRAPNHSTHMRRGLQQSRPARRPAHAHRAGGKRSPRAERAGLAAEAAGLA